MQRMQLRTEGRTTPVFDSDAVRQILVRAATIQEQAQQYTLSAEQVEALGRELGLAPEAVRQALAEVTIPQGISPTVSPQVRPTVLPRMTVAQMMTSPLPGLVYSVFLAFFIRFTLGSVRLTHIDIAPLALIYAALYVVPALLAFGSGWLRRDVRAGALAGGFLALFPYIGACISIALATGAWYAPVAVELDGIAATVIGCVVLFALMVGCVSLGALGGWLQGRYAAERAERRRLQDR